MIPAVFCPRHWIAVDVISWKFSCSNNFGWNKFLIFMLEWICSSVGLETEMEFKKCVFKTSLIHVWGEREKRNPLNIPPCLQLLSISLFTFFPLRLVFVQRSRRLLIIILKHAYFLVCHVFWFFLNFTGSFRMQVKES